MKPLHVGLLVFGAAVAGGLAVRMSQVPATPQVAAEADAPRPQRPVPTSAAPVAAPVVAPPARTQSSQTSAPHPVYVEPDAPPVKWRPSPFPTARPALQQKAPVAPPPMPVAQAGYTEPPKKLVAEVKPAVPPQPVPVQTAAPERPPAPMPQVTLQPGLPVSVRLKQALTTRHSAGGDTFEAVLADPLVADGFVIAERGARVTGRVVNASSAGRVSDVSRIELALSTLHTADGQQVAIATEPWSRQDDLPVDTVLKFRLASRVTLTERHL